ncbi:hypothetical protein Z045_05855 [Rhodococcus pyridinivorans KG-16]|uniref:Uncharacterized protein n=1 Tax=Rhodococcus pyridinivorans KG-16 TaxID=1441730 RepID=A0A0V9UNW7_9NOCA|nr:hypothetical protein [Rhodococcus pyridinivorans]KSZ59690.1 hypothetical protein Z045_05855 [Rhodococcus pyridinivorans KG-16]
MAVDYRETLITYLNSETIEDAARNLGIKVSALHSRVHTMRQAGVELPKKSRPRLTRLEVDQLNTLIKKYQREAST